MKSTKTLAYQNHDLSSSERQLNLLNSESVGSIPLFTDKLKAQNAYPLKPTQLDILQVNVGKMCNQTCKHCHVDAGPDRKEIMGKETMHQCLEAMTEGSFSTLDLTGGAPEMNPDFRWFVENVAKLGIHIIVRSNLTILVANKKYYDLPQFFKENKVEVVSSLPFYTKKRTDDQRGKGVYQASIRALKMLNEVGYGNPNTDLKLNLVYNPTGSFLPGDQGTLENEYKKRLFDDHQINFNNLFTITNMPINRFLDHLVRTNNLEDYMDRLLEAYNPNATCSLMCRNTISVGWDGSLYDCDFNQMLDLSLSDVSHIASFDPDQLLKRSILFDQHCFGCTAGNGSSCGGALT